MRINVKKMWGVPKEIGGMSLLNIILLNPAFEMMKAPKY